MLKTLLPALLLSTQLHASTVDLGLDRKSYSESFILNDLDGQTSGTRSLDLTFNNSVHLFANSSNFFEIGLGLLATNPRFVTGTGYLLDVNGNPICGLRSLASAISDANDMIMGIFPLVMDGSGLPATDLTKPLDFYGVHFDITFPDTTITNGSLFLTTQGPEPFRIGPHVSEGGMSLTLFILALVFLLFYDQKAIS